MKIKKPAKYAVPPKGPEYGELLSRLVVVLEEGFGLMDVRMTELVERLPKPSDEASTKSE